MAPKQELRVLASTPMPAGYAFLPKGNQYKTLHCRKLTHEARKPLYVVEDGKKAKKVLGIRVPKSIFSHVQSLACETLASRRAATEHRDAALIRQAAAALEKEFPNIPDDEKEIVLKHGFRKYSGRVGRTGQLPMSKKAMLAVIAHIRHKHTNYDKLMDDGMKREEARKEIAKKTQEVLRGWGVKGDLSWYFYDDADHVSSEVTTPESDVESNFSKFR